MQMQVPRTTAHRAHKPPSAQRTTKQGEGRRPGCERERKTKKPSSLGAALRLRISTGTCNSGIYKQKQGRWYNHAHSDLLASGQAATHNNDPPPLLRDDAEAC
jgi:hypothetical protein